MLKDLRRRRADALALLLRQPRPAGTRTALLTTDARTRRAAEEALDEAGLLPAIVTQHCELRTRLLAPAATHTGGSVTLPGETAGDSAGVVLETLAEDPGVDAVLVAVDAATWEAARLARTLDAVSARFPRTTVVAAVPVGRGPGGRRGSAVPAYPDLHRAAQALASAAETRWNGGRKSLAGRAARHESRRATRVAALHDGGTP